MAYRYMRITDLSQTRPNEQICAVYDNPLLNTTGTRDSESITKALSDSKEGKCKLVVWRSDEDKSYYQYIDSNGRLREARAAKIVDFAEYNKANEGYTYFALALIESLVEGAQNPEDALVQVEDETGHIHNVKSAHMDPDTNTLTLKI